MQQATIEMREQLHHYIDVADDTKIAAIYILIQENLPEKNKFSAEELQQFRNTRNRYLSGEEKVYTVEEAHNIIRQSKK